MNCGGFIALRSPPRPSPRLPNTARPPVAAEPIATVAAAEEGRLPSRSWTRRAVLTTMSSSSLAAGAKPKSPLQSGDSLEAEEERRLGAEDDANGQSNGSRLSSPSNHRSGPSVALNPSATAATAASSSSSSSSSSNIAGAPAPRIRSDGKKHVEKGSLKLEDLIQAKKEASSKTQGDEGGSEEARREQKRAANRLSAFQSRQRRKIIIDDLQKTVAQLSRDHAAQGTLVAQLRLQLESTLRENEYLRAQLAATRGLLQQQQQLQQHQQVAATPAGAAAVSVAANTAHPSSANRANAAAPNPSQQPLQAPAEASSSISPSCPAPQPAVLVVPEGSPASAPNGLVAAAAALSQPCASLNPEVVGLLQELAVIQHQMLQQQQQLQANAQSQLQSQRSQASPPAAPL